MLAGNEPSDIFRQLQDEDDDGEERERQADHREAPPGTNRTRA